MQSNLRGANVLVTGGGGFLGRHLIPLLMAAGANVTCIVRQPAKVQMEAAVHILRGDCLDANSMDHAIKGQDIIIHMAAMLFGNSWQDYMRTNSIASQNLARLNNQNARRVILVSSLAAAGPCDQLPGKRESEIPAPVSAYGWSKLMSEQILSKAYQEKLVIIRPPIIYGSGDRGLLPLFKSCSSGLGITPGLRKFPVSAIHALDAARAIVLAASAPDAHGIYHIGDGHNYTMDEICRAMGKAAGRTNTRILSVPLPLMALSAAFSSCGATLYNRIRQTFGRRPSRAPSWNLDKYREARQSGWLACTERIRKELGFESEMNLEQGMAETYTGYKKAGWL